MLEPLAAALHTFWMSAGRMHAAELARDAGDGSSDEVAAAWLTVERDGAAARAVAPLDTIRPLADRAGLPATWAADLHRALMPIPGATGGQAAAAVRPFIDDVAVLRSLCPHPAPAAPGGGEGPTADRRQTLTEGEAAFLAAYTSAAPPPASRRLPRPRGATRGQPQACRATP